MTAFEGVLQIVALWHQYKQALQELTAKTSNLVTNERVAKLETDINDDLVQKISKLEAVLVAGEDKINNEDIINLRAEIDKKLKKPEENNQQIETRIQTVEGLGKQLKHLVDKVTQVETTTDINTYMLDTVIQGVENSEYSKQKFKELKEYIMMCYNLISYKYPGHWLKVFRMYNPLLLHSLK